MKVRLKFRKYGVMKFIGHLDMMRYFQKAMRRANIPIAYSQGFSPHMIMSFANPLGVGLTSDGEYFDIELIKPIASDIAIKQLNEVMVEGVEITAFVEIPEAQKTGMSIVAAADYYIIPKECEITEEFIAAFNRFVAEDHIVVMKKTKKSYREVDIRPLIYKMYLEDEKIFVQVATGSVENLKPELVMDALIDYAGEEKGIYKFNYHRVEVYAENELRQKDGQDYISLQQLGTEIRL
ncbi:MAG: TIGR03936 family radical SAM-associated protein [Eubacteriales bacterium]